MGVILAVLAALEGLLERLGLVLGRLEGILDRLGGILGRFGASWMRLGCVLDSSWEVFGGLRLSTRVPDGGSAGGSY